MSEAWFRRVLDRYPRVAIAGPPKCGKTTLALLATDRPVVHTDAFIDKGWAEQPAIIIDACRDLSRVLVEGIQVGRALRKGLKVDAVVWLDRPHAQLSEGQERMAKGVATVFREVTATNPALIVLRPPQQGAP